MIRCDLQRFFDVVFSVCALVALLPLLFIIMIILRTTGEGEVFYLQERIGKDKKIFRVIKFATMLKNSASIGSGTITLKQDPRILPFGRFLRKTKINELPQLINVIKGEMSLIGPRPQSKRCFDAYQSKAKDEISTVLPGLSGLGSIVFRDEENLLQASNSPSELYDNIIMPYKGDLEIWYVNNRTLRLYFLLIFSTLLTVVFPKSNVIRVIGKNVPVRPETLK